MNTSRARDLMRGVGIDALIASCPSNIQYVTGFPSPMEFNLSHPAGHPMFALYSLEGARAAALVLPPCDVPSVALFVPHPALPLYTYGEYFLGVEPGDCLDETESRVKRRLDERVHRESAADALVQAVRDHNLDTARLGIDEMRITHSLLTEVRRRLPKAEVVPAYDLFREIRLIKTTEEIERLRMSLRIVEDALQVAFEAITEGITEIQLSYMLRKAIIKRSGRPVLYFVGVGEKSALIDRNPLEFRVYDSSIVMFDAGCEYNGYFSDTARTKVFGRISSRITNCYRAICEGQAAAISKIRPGIRASEVFKIAVETTRNSGIPQFARSHTGHGIGIDPYDAPSISSGDDTVLEAGMVLNIEVPYYQVGFAGLQVEDTVAVTEAGYERLSSLPRNLGIVERWAAEERRERTE